jgi:hypothetical protein
VENRVENSSRCVPAKRQRTSSHFIQNDAEGEQTAFLKKDTEEMARLVAAAAGKPGMDDMLFFIQADTEAWYGRLENLECEGFN